MLVRARNKGWRVVVFNSRGCADSPVTTPQMYSGSFLGDLDEVVKHVGSRYPKANLYGAGWSMGANILVQYLGKDLCQGFNRIYNRSLGKALGGILKKHFMLFEDLGGEYNIPLADNAEVIRDYDEGLTRVSFGFKSVDEYLQNSCSANYIKHVQTPLLCIQAKNETIPTFQPYYDTNEVDQNVYANKHKERLDRLIDMLTSSHRKVLACVVCGRLKSAFQIASRNGSVADVQYVAHQALHANALPVLDMCKQWLAQYM